jgi:hypothetical protein
VPVLSDTIKQISIAKRLTRSAVHRNTGGTTIDSQQEFERWKWGMEGNYSQKGPYPSSLSASWEEGEGSRWYLSDLRSSA